MVRKNNSKNTSGKTRTDRVSGSRFARDPEAQGNKNNGFKVPLQLQQKILNIFQEALNPDEGDNVSIQEVKGHLFRRDFATAFGQPEYLRAYASRWSPSRALGYTSIFADIKPFIISDVEPVGDLVSPRLLKVTCIGGGAGAELVSLAALINLANRETEHQNLAIEVCLMDIAGWDEVTTALYEAIITPPALSKYASATARAANISMLPEASFKVGFHQQNVLEEDPRLSDRIKDTYLVTLMFTLNELYSTSMSQTQKLLAQITKVLKPGSHLLVVDSPGSYSTVPIGGNDKSYPMQWLLDHTMLGPPMKHTGDDVPPSKWEKLVSDDSKWYRLPPGLEYPLELENMRYQIHLYRRLAVDS